MRHNKIRFLYVWGFASFSYSKRLVPQSRNILNGIFQTKHKASIELDFFDRSNSKRFYSEPDVDEYNKGSMPQHDLIIGTETMKELGIAMDFESQYDNL